MSRSQRLAVVLALNVVLVVGLVAVGLSAQSLGVLAAGADYLADAAAIGVSLLAVYLSARPPTTRHPDGFPKATVIAASINGGWLLALSLFVIAGAIDRLVTGSAHVDGLPVLIVSGLASMVMMVAAVILGGDVDDHGDVGGNLNVRSVLLDTAADAAAAAGVAATGAIIFATGRFFWLDATVAWLIAIVVAYQALMLLREVIPMLRRPVARRDGRSR